jgi:hypothetical protein
MAFNNKSPNTHSRHLTVILEANSPDHKQLPHTTSRYTMPPHSTPLHHPITYQAFREITTFIRDNGDDWDEF